MALKAHIINLDKIYVASCIKPTMNTPPQVPQDNVG